MNRVTVSRRELLKGALAALSVTPLACGRTTEETQAARVKSALTRLLQREIVDGFHPSVILEEVDSKKFVQFSGSREEPLVLDLPSPPLDEQDRARAEAFFARLGVTRQPLFDDQYVYNVNLGNDIDRAAELALRVFREVYWIPDNFVMKVTEN